MAEPPSILYHYTSVDALVKIVKSKQFHVTSVFFMNDSEEQVYLQRQAIQQLEQEPQSNLRDSMIDGLRGRTFRDMFCGCFSKEGDLLSQWRAYADDGRGVAIGFNTEFLKTRPVLKRVLYEPHEQQEVIDQCLEQHHKALVDSSFLPNVVYNARAMFAMHGLYCKNRAFREEQEYRIFIVPESAFDEKPSGPLKTVFYKGRKGLVVPFMILPLLLDPRVQPITEIVLGPKHPVPENEYSIPRFLKSKDFGDVMVRRSAASYR